MTFVLARQDIQELLGDARYAAEQNSHPELIDLFTTPNCVRNLIGQMIHVIANSHYDPGSITTYNEVIDGFAEPYEGGAKDICKYVLHEMYMGLRGTIDPWIDKGWLHDVEIIEDKLEPMDRLSGFLITPMLAPRIGNQYSDLIPTGNLVEHMNSKSY